MIMRKSIEAFLSQEDIDLFCAFRQFALNNYDDFSKYLIFQGHNHTLEYNEKRGQILYNYLKDKESQLENLVDELDDIDLDNLEIDDLPIN